MLVVLDELERRRILSVEVDNNDVCLVGPVDNTSSIDLPNQRDVGFSSQFSLFERISETDRDQIPQFLRLFHLRRHPDGVLLPIIFPSSAPSHKDGLLRREVSDLDDLLADGAGRHPVPGPTSPGGLFRPRLLADRLTVLRGRVD